MDMPADHGLEAKAKIMCHKLSKADLQMVIDTFEEILTSVALNFICTP